MLGGWQDIMLDRVSGAERQGMWGAELQPAELPGLLGAVTGLSDGVLHGWVQDPANPLRAVVFDLEVGAAGFGRHIANMPPNAAPGGRAGSVSCGFAVPLTGLPPGLHRCVLRDVTTGRTLPSQIVVPELPPADLTGAAASPSVPNILHVGSQHADGPPADGVTDGVAGPAPDGGTASDEVTAAAAAILADLRPAELQKAVEKEFKAENWPLVVALTERILPADATADHRVVAHRGRAFIYLKRFEDAVDTLRWFRQHQPNRHGSLFYYGVALSNLHQIAEAREVFLECLKAAPNEKRYAFEAARITARLVNGDFGALDAQPALLDQAIALARRAAELHPTDARPMRDLAHLVLQSGAADEGLELLRKAVARAPANAALHLDLARALARQGRVEQALEAAREAAKLDPLRDGAGFACRILERWMDARRRGPFTVALAGGADAAAA